MSDPNYYVIEVIGAPEPYNIIEVAVIGPPGLGAESAVAGLITVAAELVATQTELVLARGDAETATEALSLLSANGEVTLAAALVDTQRELIAARDDADLSLYNHTVGDDPHGDRAAAASNLAQLASNLVLTQTILVDRLAFS